jgi:hypothetical protein
MDAVGVWDAYAAALAAWMTLPATTGSWPMIASMVRISTSSSPSVADSLATHR